MQKTYVKPEVLERYSLRTPTGEKHLVQVEREMNPKSHNFGKKYLAYHPGDKWMRLGPITGEGTEVFSSLKATMVGTMTEYQRIAYYFDNTLKVGEPVEGYRLEKL